MMKMMMMNPRIWLSVLLLMSGIVPDVAADQCHEKEHSVYGMFLKGHTFKTVQAGFPAECYLRCEQEIRCQSYNVIIGRNICELNSRTKEARPEDFMPDWHRFYMRRAFDRAPLGSVKDLAAESCSEIMASEGDEMAKNEHWIYSDGNGGQAILAKCEDNWQKINADPVCFGSRDDNYGAFYITKTGHVNTMKLVHKNGSIHCNANDGDSYWACLHPSYYNKLMTMITNARKEVLLPQTEDLEGLSNFGASCQKPHFYSLGGIGIKSPQLVFRNLSNPLFLSRGQELQIWYGQDLVGCGEDKNTGTTCVDVYALYI